MISLNTNKNNPFRDASRWSQFLHKTRNSMYLVDGLCPKKHTCEVERAELDSVPGATRVKGLTEGPTSYTTLSGLSGMTSQLVYLREGKENPQELVRYLLTKCEASNQKVLQDAQRC